MLTEHHSDVFQVLIYYTNYINLRIQYLTNEKSYEDVSQVEIPSTTVYGEFGSTTAILIGPKFPNVSLNKGCRSFDWVLYLCLISWAWGQLLNQVKALAGYSVWTPSTEMKYCHFSPGNSFLLSFHTVRKKGKITYMYWDIYKTMLIYKIYSVLFSHEGPQVHQRKIVYVIYWSYIIVFTSILQ